jgi:hypothetical protein
MADKDKGQGATLLLSGTAAALSLANLLRKPAEQLAGSFPPEVIELLQGIAAGTLDVDNVRLPEILAAILALGGGGPGSAGYPPNADYPISGTHDFLVALTAFNLPDITIPDDFEITVKAYPTNPPLSLVYVAKSSGESADRYVSYPLMPNESRGYRIKNAKELWVSATVAPGCSVTWTVEQRR